MFDFDRVKEGGRSAVPRRMFDVLSLVIVIGAVGIIATRQVGVGPVNQVSPGAESGVSDLSPRQFAEMLESGEWLGSQDSPVRMLVYCSFGCGACASLFETLTTLRQRYPQHLAVIWKDIGSPDTFVEHAVYLGALCAGDQDRFEEYAAVGFRNPQVAGYSRGWRILGDSVELPDPAQFERCVRLRQHLDRIVEDHDEAVGLGVRVTPKTIVNGRVWVGSLSETVLDSLVSSHLPGR
jgi:protein-disulfide isomerase